LGIFRFPFVIFVATLLLLWLSTRVGAFCSGKRKINEDERDDLDLVVNASLTLLALIIGFSFSMAVSRYDQRKTYEEAEANAIGTEYARADLLPAPDAAKVKTLLVKYVDQRILYYTETDSIRHDALYKETAQAQNELWSAIRPATSAQPTPVAALAVSGMNDVLNSQDYTEAGFLNRIPAGAWYLMFGIALCCALLIGYVARQKRGVVYLIMPLLVAIAFLLIADIDSPRRGIIKVAPQNLMRLAQSFRQQ
jgi:hypothetical protein